MFRVPSSPIVINQAPTKLGLDAFNMYRDISGAPWDLFYIPAGQKIHLPGCTVSGGKAYYQSKEINLWISMREWNGTSYEYMTSVVTNLNDATWQLGTDANGAYVEVLSTYYHWNVLLSIPYISGEMYVAMVYPENNYSTWPYSGPIPPAYDTSNIY